MSGTVPLVPAAEEFRGKVAMVTGGTNGLGKHLTEALVALGAEVFYCGRDEHRGRLLEERLQGRGHFARCELANVDDARAWVRAAGESNGRIDYLVNNAAIDPRNDFRKATAEDFDRAIAINLRPFFVVSQAALPYMEAGEGKAVVNICTTNYMLGCEGFTIYNASKSGIVGFSRSLARELGPCGIRVNTVSPGWIMTDRQIAEHVSREDQDALLEAQAMKFLLNESHVTPVTLFLLSRASAGVTGQNLIVDAGKVMR
ncbi:MAG TPA: SDR family oxidoreductase [Phycisphaerae bacterium]|nr:SDR family oxidoreductase [Phycisphaerae bacterium]HUT62045.1 SDR family oxidoreductase [Phycisphaerae bacterium]